MRKSALFSDDRVYRYTLIRAWDCTKPRAVFVGLNPSTADETEDDPTIRRCIGFAKDWGMGAMCMLNIFALRATDPKVMRAHPEPVGADNDFHLKLWTAGAGVVVACWGVHGEHLHRGREVRELLAHRLGEGPSVFGLTKDGHPKHPLYLARSQQLARWTSQQLARWT